MAKRKRTIQPTRLLAVAIVFGLVFLAIAAFRAGPEPEIVIEPDLPGIGRRTIVRVTASEPKRGLSKVRVEFVQGDRVEMLEERRHEPREPWRFWGHRTDSDDMTVRVGTELQKGLRDGDATIRVTADRARAWLRWPAPAIASLTLPVTLRPPALQVHSLHTRVAQGGSEAVVYTVGDSSVRDGVQVGDLWFPGYPLPGSERRRFALFAVPFDLGDASKIRLVAVDAVRNESRVAFVDRFIAKRVKTDTIRLSQSFMERVVPAILAQTPELQDQGNLLDNYLMLNGELRKVNAAELVELAAASEPRFLWNREFLQMRNAEVMSDFADRRTYLYEGAVVDQQDHLGFDLASVRRAEIQAANSGVVVMAKYFGIYGNTVVLDHGYGLMTLYSHLSSIAVEPGQEIERGAVLGRSGVTGLAGGDHLHFSVLLNGMPVNPTEWWDAHWISDRLKLKLGEALPFGE